VFEHRVLRKIFGFRRDEVTGEWRKLHSEELNDLVTSPSIFRVLKSRTIRGAGHVARMGQRYVAYRISMRKPQGKVPLGRSRSRWEENIKINLQELGCGDMDWIELAQDWNRWRALVNTVMNLPVPLNAGNFCSR